MLANDGVAQAELVDEGRDKGEDEPVEDGPRKIVQRRQDIAARCIVDKDLAGFEEDNSGPAKQRQRETPEISTCDTVSAEFGNVQRNRHRERHEVPLVGYKAWRQRMHNDS